MSQSHYPWFEKSTDKLQQAFENKRLPHGLLIVSPQMSGKSEYALTITKRLLCEQYDGLSDYCDQCKSCLLINSKTHPDFYFIERLVDNKGKQKKSIGIEQIRTLTDKLVDTPQLGGWRVAVIRSVTAMTRGAFNALLKTLEEPKSNTLLILLADNAQKVPATIRSRCQIVVPELVESTMVEWLVTNTGKTIAEIKQALKSCYSAPLAAKSYLENNGEFTEQQTFKMLDKILLNQLSPSEFFARAELDDEDLANVIANYFYQAEVICATSQEKHQYAALPPKILFNLYAKVLEYNRAQHAGSNLQAKLQFEAILIQWFEIGRKIVHYSKA
ncbi:DNA polymerase III subunit [Aliikangiella sp. IMCC44359]|uniref:DNA polymerase III subunit n=1 Tax=Aliikangiella sp. IMCC44359 TaxID=3459125 RepID=UPI00403A8179